MLPLPGSPSSSWARFCERFKAIFSGADPRVCIAFWLFGKNRPLIQHETFISRSQRLTDILRLVSLRRFN